MTLYERRKNRSWPTPSPIVDRVNTMSMAREPRENPPDHSYVGDKTTVPPEACRNCGSHWSAPFHKEGK